jgi:DNA polymerase III gamma/tau subunit
MELYKKYRPKTLDKIMACTLTAELLKTMLERKTLPHALLFTGPKGCGKTSMARIVKDELKCSDMDFREINAANFRGIDTIREIQSVMDLSPCLGDVRVWLLDEVHKLSNDAQTAALKMLEDTPSHVYFLLATTEPEKLIPTFRSRPTEMQVRLFTHDEMLKLCHRVAKRESIQLTDDVYESIIDVAEGCARDALVILDKIRNLPSGKWTEAIDEERAKKNEAIDLCKALIGKKPWPAVAAILKNLKGEPEKIRHAVLGYAKWSILAGKDTFQAYTVIKLFENHFYDSHMPGLVAAAYEAVASK